MNIVARARGLIIRPREEWAVIAGEPSDTVGLFKNYVIPMSAIPAVAGFIGLALFARMFAPALPGFSVGALLVQSVVSYLLGLAGVWVFGKIAQALSPRFGGTGEEVPAMKLAAHSPTASWLAGVFAAFPPLAIFGLLGLYSLYILYKGVPATLGVSGDRVLVFTMALIGCGLLIYLLVGFVVSSLLVF